MLNRTGVVKQVADLLAEADIQSAVDDGTKPNPSTADVEAGLALRREKQCDCVFSLGGASPHDCAKGIALCATNRGRIADYEGVDKSAKPQLPLIAINTTAGTASEMTRVCIIPDEARHVKMAIVDKPPILSVDDPALLLGIPVGLTELGVKREDIPTLAANALKDACDLTNPIQPTQAEVEESYAAAL